MIKLQKSTFLNEAETKRKLCEFIASADFLSMGDQCKKFEEKFSKKQGRKHSVFVNSGSSANLILIQSLMNLGRIRRGDLVGVSALTWATNIMPLLQLGLRPFLIDCEITTLNVSMDTLNDALKVQPNIKALFITNTLGLSADIQDIKEFCNENALIFIEDNCESLGSSVNGRQLGNFGLASTFSFFVGHHISTIEGGMVCTDDDILYEALVMARAHGWDRNLMGDAQKNLRSKYGVSDFYSKYTFYDLAYNVRPTEINGFIGNTQIDLWDYIVSTRFENFKIFNEVISSNTDLQPIFFNHMEVVSSFAVPVIVRSESLVEAYKRKFEASAVEIRPMIAGNMSRQPFYLKYVDNPGMQTNADFLHRHSFYFGNYPELENSEIEILCDLLSNAE